VAEIARAVLGVPATVRSAPGHVRSGKHGVTQVGQVGLHTAVDHGHGDAGALGLRPDQLLDGPRIEPPLPLAQWRGLGRRHGGECQGHRQTRGSESHQPSHYQPFSSGMWAAGSAAGRPHSRLSAFPAQPVTRGGTARTTRPPLGMPDRLLRVSSLKGHSPLIRSFQGTYPAGRTCHVRGTVRTKAQYSGRRLPLRGLEGLPLIAVRDPGHKAAYRRRRGRSGRPHSTESACRHLRR